MTGAVSAVAADNAARIREKTWLPQLSITAIEGYPLPENGGNVLLPYSVAKLSLRVPPTCNAEVCEFAR